MKNLEEALNDMFQTAEEIRDELKPYERRIEALSKRKISDMGLSELAHTASLVIHLQKSVIGEDDAEREPKGKA